VTNERCPHCKANTAFHRALLALAAGRHIPAYVALPSVQKQTPYLKSIASADTRSLDWADLDFKVKGTPTIVSVGAGGVVKGIWIGELSELRQKEFLSAYGTTSDWPGPDPPVRRIQDLANLTPKSSLNEEELASLARIAEVAVVDTRERPDYKNDHIAGAINIPIFELPLRASMELSRAGTQVLDCRNQTDVNCEYAAKSLDEDGFKRILYLKYGSYFEACPWKQSGVE